MNHFYDIHCHAFNLSHANLIAIIKRLFSEFARTSRKGVFIPLLIFSPIILIMAIPILFFLGLAFLFFPNTIKKLFIKLFDIFGYKIMNFLSIMQNDLGSQFIILDDDVKDLFKNKPIEIGENKYDKIVLTPLMMDFGYKGIDSFKNIHYNKIYRKTIAEQATDLFNGIKKYRDNRPDINHNEEGDEDKEKGIFEIYPFLGLNTQNYPLEDETSATMDKRKPKLDSLPEELRDKIKFFPPRFHFRGEMNEEEREKIKAIFKGVDKDRIERIYENSQNIEERNDLKKLLDKYFKDFSPEESPEDRYNNLYQKFLEMKDYDGDIDNLGGYNFAGIKIYPPLGFNPWPVNDEIELQKVCYLYNYCQEKSIPITTHCSKGGFRVVGKETTEEYNSPVTWKKVLDEYPELKLNFAHFGGKLSAGKWQKKIVELILNDKYPNVYVDISYVSFNDKSYKSLEKTINKLCKSEEENGKVKSKILFGTDFSVNLFEINSYQDYIKFFANTDKFTKNKNSFCCKNPQEFLFLPNREIKKEDAQGPIKP